MAQQFQQHEQLVDGAHAHLLGDELAQAVEGAWGNHGGCDRGWHLKEEEHSQARPTCQHVIAFCKLVFRKLAILDGPGAAGNRANSAMCSPRSTDLG